MSEFTGSNAPTPAGEPSWYEAYRSLRNLLNILTLAIVVLCGGLAVFFMKEISLIRKQSEEFANTVADHEKNAAPVIEEFRAKMEAYARTDPKFQPVYARYYGNPAGAQLAPAPVTTNTPRPAPAPAKRN